MSELHCCCFAIGVSTFCSDLIHTLILTLGRLWRYCPALLPFVFRWWSNRNIANCLLSYQLVDTVAGFLNAGGSGTKGSEHEEGSDGTTETDEEMASLLRQLEVIKSRATRSELFEVWAAGHAREGLGTTSTEPSLEAGRGWPSW